MRIIAIIFLLFLDQVSKQWSRTVLKPVSSIEIIPDFFHLTYIENRGAAFGMLQGRQFLFIVITIIFLIFFQRMMQEYRAIKYFSIFEVLIVAGVLGNFLDRILFGFVTDMVDFRGIWSYVFNIADSYLVIGLLGMIALLFFDDKKRKQEVQ